MTTAATISGTMHAFLKRDVAKAHATSAKAMDLMINRLTVYPMGTMTQTIKFSLTPPGETTREFVFTATLSEQTTPDGNVTPGWADVR